MIKNTQSKQIDTFKEGRCLYIQPPQQDPKRYQIVKYSTWRIRLYQQLQSLTMQQVLAKKVKNFYQMFPNLSSTNDQKQYFTDLNMGYSNSYQQDSISHFVCRMLYSRDIKNHDNFIKNQRTILAFRLHKIDSVNTSPAAKMDILKNLVEILISVPRNQLQISKQDYAQNQSKILNWYSNTKGINHNCFMKIPFQLAQYGLRKRKCFVKKGYVYADIDTTVQVVLSHYSAFLKQQLMKTRIHTQKVLVDDIQNQLKPFMDKAINSIANMTIQDSQLNSQFKLSLKTIDGVAKKFFPPCMLNLNKKLKQNNHLRHDGRRQLWLFFKGCGMDVNDNKQYFSKHLALKVSNSDLKNHLYNIQHAYGIKGNKKQPQRSKTCRGIILGSQPRKDQHHGCPFKHWGKQALKDFLHLNYSLTDLQMKTILQEKQNNSYMVACGRLFQANFKPQKQNLPEQITNQLAKSPQNYFIAGMMAKQWINTKTLRPLKNAPKENNKMELQF